MFLLTHSLKWLYAVPIAAKTVIWFDSQEDKRIAALRGIFTSVHMASPFFWAGRFGEPCARRCLSPVCQPIRHRPPDYVGRYSQTEKEDLSHDNT